VNLSTRSCDIMCQVGSSPVPLRPPPVWRPVLKRPRYYQTGSSNSPSLTWRWALIPRLSVSRSGYSSDRSPSAKENTLPSDSFRIPLDTALSQDAPQTTKPDVAQYKHVGHVTNPARVDELVGAKVESNSPCLARSGD
jgi:hypothetical protein